MIYHNMLHIFTQNYTVALFEESGQLITNWYTMHISKVQNNYNCPPISYKLSDLKI